MAANQQLKENAINRVLKAHGLGSLDEPGILETLGRIVEDHAHFTELLRACEPRLRREMYEALRPHLRFPALPLEDYIIRAKQHAESAQLPTMDDQGFLHAYHPASIEAPQIVPQVEFPAVCSRCGKEAIFAGARKADAIYGMRSAGWAFDESVRQRHICPECLEGI